MMDEYTDALDASEDNRRTTAGEKGQMYHPRTEKRVMERVYDHRRAYADADFDIQDAADTREQKSVGPAALEKPRPLDMITSFEERLLSVRQQLNAREATAPDAEMRRAVDGIWLEVEKEMAAHDAPFHAAPAPDEGMPSGFGEDALQAADAMARMHVPPPGGEGTKVIDLETAVARSDLPLSVGTVYMPLDTTEALDEGAWDKMAIPPDPAPLDGERVPDEAFAGFKRVPTGATYAPLDGLERITPPPSEEKEAPDSVESLRGQDGHDSIQHMTLTRQEALDTQPADQPGITPEPEPAIDELAEDPMEEALHAEPAVRPDIASEPEVPDVDGLAEDPMEEVLHAGPAARPEIAPEPGVPDVDGLAGDPMEEALHAEPAARPDIASGPEAPVADEPAEAPKQETPQTRDKLAFELVRPPMEPLPEGKTAEETYNEALRLVERTAKKYKRPVAWLWWIFAILALAAIGWWLMNNLR